MDARFDKTKIGCINNKVFLGVHSYKKRAANFPDSLHHYLSKLIKDFAVFSPGKEDTLYILVKKFRIAEGYSTSVQQTINDYLTLNFSASFYSLNNGRYSKLFSIEDLQSAFVDMNADVKLSLQRINSQRSSLINKMIYKMLAYKKWEAKEGAVVFSKEVVTAGLEKRFALPVYGQQAPIGLYKTFTEFKNAAPSVSGIKITYENGRIKEVSDESGAPILLKGYWGLSDGKKNYMIVREEASELIACGKSFRVLSYRTVAELTGRAIPGDGKYSGFMGSFSGGKKVEEYFDLDMDSGQLFLEEIYWNRRQKTLHGGKE